MSTTKQVNAVPTHPQFSPKPLAYWVSSLTIASCLASGAIAQEVSSTPVSGNQIASAGKTGEEVQVVEVLGTRQAEANAINRKKKARTAQDSIIAEDVGKMPDQNVGEAISRIAGVSLDRGDSGEGVGISIRGQSPDLTRVEIDGQAMMSGGGASSGMNGTLADITRSTGDGPSGRGQGMRDLPADLIKSVDVIKGSTADMTEGSLGGSVQIKTRNGLDFKERYTSIKITGTQGSINTEIEPAYTVVFADQFMDGRLGVLFNASGNKITNEGHSVQTSDNGRGYDHLVDFDNSPEKTFSFNPSTFNQNSATVSGTTPFITVPTTTAGTNWTSETPLSFLTKAGAAQSKADCYAAFPGLTAGEVASISGAANQANARGQRSNELIGCLNQWNDWTPQNVRYLVRRDYEDRQNFDLRLDFKVTDELSVYAKGSKSSRDILNSFETYSMGGLLAINPAATTAAAPGIYKPGYTGTGFTTAAGVTTATPNSGYYTYTNNVSWTNATQVTGIAGIKNLAVNIDPSSVYVDKNHHVTNYSYSNGIATTDQIDSDQETDIRYFQAGGTFERDNLLAEFMLGDAESKFTRNDVRVAWSTLYGAGTATLLPGGLWSYDAAEGSSFDQTNPAGYVALKPAANATSPQYTNAVSLNQQQPRLAETEEKTAKLDVTYKFEGQIPFITQVKSGLNYRETDISGWGNGGGAISANPVITLGTNNARGSVTGCENTTGSSGTGGTPCAYGYVTQPIQSRDVVLVVTQAELQNMIDQSMKPASADFLKGMKGRAGGLLDGWNQIDVKKFYTLAGATGHFSLDCIKECIASDGNTYKQPESESYEETLAGYVMADFEVNELPYGMELTGNVGVRVVENTTTATGFVGLRSIVLTDTFNPDLPDAAGGFIDTTVYKNVSVEKTERNTLPSVNLGLWMIPDELVLRYSWGKTLARPSVAQMLPAGTCTYDLRKLLTDVDEEGQSSDMSCGRFGNPEIKSYQNKNTNISVEWYPTKGQMVSAAVFNNKSEVGGGVLQSFTNRKIFAGSDAMDPATGAPLSSIDYAGTTWVNGPGYNFTGIELSSKSAFTFLPWKLQYTGIDLNYTTMDYDTSSVGQFRDLNSGKKLPPRGLVPKSYNVALWYDDGKVNARISYQWRDEIFLGLSRGQGNGTNYPGVGGMEDWVRWAPYNPGAPRFSDPTGFLDAKISYRFDDHFDVYLEGRNLNRAPMTISSGGYYDFEDGTRNVEEYKYFGRKLVAGMTYKF